MAARHRKASKMLADGTIASLAAERDALALEVAALRTAFQVRAFDDDTYAVSVAPERWEAVRQILAAPPGTHGAAILRASDALVGGLQTIQAMLEEGMPAASVSAHCGDLIAAYRRVRGQREGETV